MPVRVSTQLLRKLQHGDAPDKSEQPQATQAQSQSDPHMKNSKQERRDDTSEPQNQQNSSNAAALTPDMISAATGGVIPAPPATKAERNYNSTAAGETSQQSSSKQSGNLLLKRQEEVQKAHSLADALLAKEAQRSQRVSAQAVPCAEERSSCAQCFKDNPQNLLHCKAYVNALKQCARGVTDTSNSR